MTNYHRINLNGVCRDLPIREVEPGVYAAIFDLLGDWELTEAVGEALATRVPAETEALVMPDGKASALLHVMGRITKLPTFVARKERKSYMAKPVASVSVKSITTPRVQELHLGHQHILELRGKKVVIVDDVISSGGTINAMSALLDQAEARLIGFMAAFTEGTPKPEVIALGHLPLF